MFKIISESPGLPKIETSKEVSVDQIHCEFDKINWNECFLLAGEIFDESTHSKLNEIAYFNILDTETEHKLILTIARNDKLEEKILAMHNWETIKSSFWGLLKSSQNNGSASLLINGIEAKKIIDLFLERKYDKLDATLKEHE